MAKEKHSIKYWLILFLIILEITANSVVAGNKTSNQGPPQPPLSNMITPQTTSTNNIGGVTNNCRGFIERIKEDFSKISGGFYDFFTVPENPADPTSPKLRIFYYGIKIDGQIPVVFFNGGPAYSSHSSYEILIPKEKGNVSWSKIPFIFIDQRGTGCSDAYPQGQTDDVLKRLTHYGTRGIVNDAELIRAHLGYKKWKVFGQSYGAFLVHRYMVVAPQSITAAYAHGGVITSDPIQRLTGRIESQNRVIEDYLKNYPNDQAVLKTLDAKLTPTTCFNGTLPDQNVCGTYVLSPLLDMLGFTDEWPSMSTIFNDLVSGDQLNSDGIQKYLNQNVFFPPVAGRSSYFASEVIGWADRNVAEITKETCTQVYSTLTAKGETPETWLYNECYAPLKDPTNYSHTLMDRVVKLPQDLLTILDFKQALRDNPKIPFFLYAGEEDPYVPVSDFQEELKAVGPLVRYTLFPKTGHDGFYDENQVWNDLTAY